LSEIDWVILISTLLVIVIYGTWKTRGGQNMESYLKGNQEAKWWTVGLSVMATQASAITFMSTPGQAFHDGMGFVQFYFGLPLAMIVICFTFIPIYHRLRVYTAYEYLEQRFDLKTRSLTASLFLIQRGLAAGITIYAPSIILSTILGWDLTILNIVIGSLVIIYTMSGGTKAVNITQKQQMFVIMSGMIFAFFYILYRLPENIGFTESLSIASISDKLNIVDFSFDPNSRYTFWSGITGGFFLALSYFGTDQSQVQRYLSGRSVKESTWGLIFNGILKVPMQFFILLTGVMVFVFYQFNSSPIHFNSATLKKVEATEYAKEISQLQSKQDSIFLLKSIEFSKFDSKSDNINDEHKANILSLLNAEKDIRNDTKNVIEKALPGTETNDKDYVFISFILTFLPVGLIGLLLAVIFSAAMSSTAAELNALATTSCIDIYKRSINKNDTDSHYVITSKLLTVLWGILAIIFACYGTLFENLIQLVNIIGSVFYGTILGIFISGFYFKYIRGSAVFYAAILTEIIILLIYFYIEIGYLWLNAIGCILVIIFGIIFQTMTNQRELSEN